METVDDMRTWMTMHRQSERCNVDWSNACSIECYEWIMGLMEGELEGDPDKFRIHMHEIIAHSSAYDRCNLECINRSLKCDALE